MREILFRGKRLDGIWEEGYYFAKPILNYHCILNGENQYQVDPTTLGQFTGLMDKNKVKIFEGDYVKVVIKKYGYDGVTETETTQKGLVAYDSIGMIGLVLEVRDGRNLWSDCFLELSMSDSIIDYRFEVIGNIHDNPKLLR